LSLKLFKTTLILLKLIAIHANHGISNHKAAIGISIALYANAQKRFCLIIAYVFCASDKACGTVLGELCTKTISADSIAISDHCHIATPRSDCASAGASFIQSHTNATRFHALCSSLTFSAFWCGNTSAKKSVTHSCFAILATVAFVSQLKTYTCMFESSKDVTASKESDFNVSIYHIIQTTFDCLITRLTVCHCDCRLVIS